jgi:hypothetical protein
VIVGTGSTAPGTRRLVTLIGTICGVLFLAGSAGAKAPSPSRMVLTLYDLPPGFVAVAKETGPRTNADIVREFGRSIAPKLVRWGRLSGYAAVYRQSDPQRGALPGVFTFKASVSLYRTAAGAHASQASRQNGCRRKEFERIPLAGHRAPGPDTLVCTEATTINGTRLRLFLVQWRNARATAGVAVAEIEGATTPQAALTAAYEQNGHMAAALSRH